MNTSCYTSWNGRQSVLSSLVEQAHGPVTRDRVMSYLYSDQFREKYGDFSTLPVDEIGQEPTFEWVQKNILSEQVNYQLKAVNILQSDKAVQIFKKAKENNWNSLDKILQELQVPKEQRKLITDMGLDGREEILLELASKYSYAIEVKTVTERIQRDQSYLQPWERDEEALQTVERNTSHYSNLTVPGGTNYTENEISTPLITPSIKGHAQFSTDQGIGWFRGDEQTKKGTGRIDEWDDDKNQTTVQNFVGGTPLKPVVSLRYSLTCFNKEEVRKN
jgi:hypothetical protein